MEMRKNCNISHIFATVLGACALFLAPVGLTQEAFEEPGAEGVEEAIGVTALRVFDETSVQDIAAPITAYDQLGMEESFIILGEQIAAFTPSAGYSSRGFTDFSLRGADGLGNHPGSPGSVATFEGGTYWKGPYLPLDSGSFLTNRLEIMRDAQDVAYGHGAIGGVVDRISFNPGPDGKPRYHSRFVGGEFGRRDMGIGATGNFTNVFGYSFSILESGSDGNIENSDFLVGNVGTLGHKYQEFQMQIGGIEHGRSGRLFVRGYNINQDNSPRPRSRLNPYNDAVIATGYDRSASPLTAGDSNPLFIDVTEEFNLAKATPVLADLSVVEEPLVLEQLSNPWRTNQNYAGNESLDSTTGNILGWDLNFGSYARMSFLSSYNELNHTKSEDADLLNNTEVDLRTWSNERSKYYSREMRLGTRGKKRFLSWMVGGYKYYEETSSQQRSYDNGSAFSPAASWNVAPMASQGASEGWSNLSVTSGSVLSDYHAEVQVDSEAMFSSIALNFGGLVLAMATRTADTTKKGSDRDISGYAGSGSAWAKYRERQWDYIRGAVSGDQVGEITTALDLDALKTALTADGIDATALEDLTWSNLPGFYGTAGMDVYFATVAAQLAAVDPMNTITGPAGFDAAIEDPTAAWEQLQNLRAALAMQTGLGLDTDYSLNPAVLQSYYLSFVDPVTPTVFMDMETEANASVTACTTSRGYGRCLEETYSGESTRATLELSLGGEHMFYGNMLEGYKAGGFLASSANGVANPLLKPETLEGSEFGFKFGWRPFKLNIASFEYEYTDMQSSMEYLRSDGIFYRAPLNLEKTEVSGTEIEFTWKPFSWAHLHLVQSDLESKVVMGSWTAPINALAGGGEAVSLIDKVLPNTPETRIAANLQVRLSNQVVVSMNRREIGEQYFTVLNSPRAYMPEHSIDDLRLIVRSKDARNTFTVYVNNFSETVSWNHAVQGNVNQATVADDGTVTLQAVDTYSSVALDEPTTAGIQFDFRF